MSGRKNHKRIKTEEGGDAASAQESADDKSTTSTRPFDAIACFDSSFDYSAAKAYIQDELNNEEEIDRHLKIVQNARRRLVSVQEVLDKKKTLLHRQRLDAAGACYVCEKPKDDLDDPTTNEMLECGCLLDGKKESKRSSGLRVCGCCFEESYLESELLSQNDAYRCSLCRSTVSCGDTCCTKLLRVAAAERDEDDDDEFGGSNYCDNCYDEGYSCDPVRDYSFVCLDCTAKMGLCEDEFLFQCRQCKSPLVPKVTFREMKRGTLVTNSLMGMPSVVLDKIVCFVGLFSMDLAKLATVSSRFRSSSERVARGIVEETRQLFPSGPVRFYERDEESWDGWPGYQCHPERVYAMGTNDGPLAAPQDEKTWKEVLYLLEKLTEYSFAFSFQSEASLETASEFLRDQEKMKFTKFISEYSSDDLNKVVYHCQLAGSSKLKANKKDVLAVANDNPVNEAQVQRVIGHLRFSRAEYEPFWVGLVSETPVDLASSGTKPQKFGFYFAQEPYTYDGERVIVRGEATFGIEYNPVKQLLTMYSTDHWTGWNWNGSLAENKKVDRNKAGDRLYWAASIQSEVISQPGTLLSIRKCSEADEWNEFLTYHKKEVHKMRRASERHEERREAFYEECPNLDFDEFGGDFFY